MLRVLTAAVVFALALTDISRGQGTQADYDRANLLRQTTRDKVFRRTVKPHWSKDGNRFWYRIDAAPGAYEFVLVDAATGTRDSAFDHTALAKLLSEKLSREVSADKLPLKSLEFTDQADVLRVIGDWGRRLLNRTTGELTDEETSKPENSDRSGERNRDRRRSDDRSEKNSEEKPSPDGKSFAFVRDNRLFLREAEQNSDQAVALTQLGSPANSYNARHIFWSPDSKRIVALKTRQGDEHEVAFVESAPRDQLQPKLHSHDYLKPGDEIPQPVPHLFDVEQQSEFPIDDSLYPNPWMSDPEIHWAPDSSRFFYVYNQRGHQVLRVISIDASTGTATAIVDEQSKTFIDYAYKKYVRFFDDSNELIWMSERDGWNHLYLIDSVGGDVKNQITRGEWVVRRVDRIDDKERQIWFQASGIHPGQDPYYIHFCRINFDGSGLTVLTEGDGTHKVDYSPDLRFFIDSYSRVDLPPVTELRSSADGKLICELERADMSRLVETGWKTPERFVSKARDGKTDIHGVIYRPSNFDPSKKYRVIEKIYAGPHGSFVPKAFSEFFTAQEVAEIGFIVVQIDGMGTSNRSKAFHDVCWKNLGDSGFPDRILWIEAAAKKYPFMNIENGVGIYGGSAGGQSSTRALLAFGDLYTVAVSDCGCHDNRMDKIWWNELWMSWPIGPHYAEQSNVTQAHKLKGKLFLTVGEVDRNVDPASTMQVVDALVKADKDFDLLVVPGKGHGVGESPYGKRRRRDFFVRHLLGIEPRGE